MSGMSLWKYVDNQSDAYWKGDLLYREAIQDLWSGKKVALFDTYTDLKLNNEYYFSSDNIQSAFSNGYAFIDVMTHGEPTFFNVDYGSPYSDYNASRLENKGYSIITTMACLTNAFDNKSDPCLSEAFIRNPNSRVLAYLGSSRQGWGYDSDNEEDIKLGPSLQYEKGYYLSLFNKSKQFKNFAKCVSDAKSVNLGLCNKYNPYRWLQFTLNPIGDSEFPIYTETPVLLTEPRFEYSNGVLKITSSEGYPNVTITSINDNENSIYKSVKNVSKEISFSNIRSNITIGLTHPNYLPILFKGDYKPASSKLPERMIFSKIDFNELVSSINNPDNNCGTIEFVYCIGNEMKIGIGIDGNVNNSEVVLTDFMGNVIETRGLLQEEKVQTLSFGVQPGFHCVTLVTNGQVADQKKFLVQ